MIGELNSTQWEKQPRGIPGPELLDFSQYSVVQLRERLSVAVNEAS